MNNKVILLYMIMLFNIKRKKKSLNFLFLWFSQTNSRKETSCFKSISKMRIYTVTQCTSYAIRRYTHNLIEFLSHSVPKKAEHIKSYINPAPGSRCQCLDSFYWENVKRQALHKLICSLLPSPSSSLLSSPAPSFLLLHLTPPPSPPPLPPESAAWRNRFHIDGAIAKTCRTTQQSGYYTCHKWPFSA